MSRLAALLVVISACGIPAHGAWTKELPTGDAPAAAMRLPLEPCRPDGVEETLLCGRLEVPEDPNRTDGRHIPIRVIVVPALSENPRSDPYVELAGGPGVPVTIGVRAFVTDVDFLRQDRDVVLIDQRGTGGSNPLECDMTTGHPNADGQLNDLFPTDAVIRCRQALERSAALDQYTTEHFVADLEAVRAWLGYEQLNLAGASYGTKAAMAYIRRHPDRVRSAVLMGVATMDAHAPMYHAPFSQRALEMLFDRCRADPACGESYPGLGKKLSRVLSRFDSGPLAMTLGGEEGEQQTWQVSRGVFMRTLHALAYMASGQRQLPWIIHRTDQGDYAPFLRAALRNPLDSMPFFDGLYLSVTCSEDVPFIDRERAYALAAGTWLGEYRLDQQFGACAHWPAGEVPGDFHAAVETDVPVLLISGELDPITPPEQAEAAMKQLSNARHIILADGAHGPGGLSILDCLFGILAEFLDHADPHGLDAGCTRTMTAPDWKSEP